MGIGNFHGRGGDGCGVAVEQFNLILAGILVRRDRHQT